MITHTYKKHEDSLKAHERVILWIATGVGSTAFLVFCILLSFTPLVFPSTLTLVQFISSGFLQLVLLPIIVIKQVLDARHDKIRADEEYKVNVKSEKDTEEILKLLKNGR
jgi:uncharacterized membrane protein